MTEPEEERTAKSEAPAQQGDAGRGGGLSPAPATPPPPAWAEETVTDSGEHRPFSPPPAVQQPWETTPPPPGPGSLHRRQPPAPRAEPEAGHRPFAPPPAVQQPWETGPRQSPSGGGAGVPPQVVEPWIVEARKNKAKRRRDFPMKPVIAGVIALVVVGGGGYGVYALMSGGDDGPGNGDPSSFADALFAVDRAAPSDGLDQSINAASAAGGTVVVAGSQTGALSPRPKFLFSADQGRTWHVAKVRMKDGGPALGRGPDAVFGAAGGWVALGAGNATENVWTSADGQTWTQTAAKPGVFTAGDVIEQVTRAGRGYIAVGHRSFGKSDAPILWRSPDGANWQRVTGRAIGMKTGKDALGALRYAVATGRTILVSGTVVKRKSTVAGVWSSTDGGRTWQALGAPTASGAFGDLHLAANRSGFLAVRRGKSGSARPGIAFRSGDGRKWEQAGTIEAGSGIEPLRLAGDDSGFALLAATADGREVAFQSADGSAWGQGADLGTGPQRKLNAVTVAGGAVVIGGSSRQTDQDYQLLVGSGGQVTPVDLRRVPGAVVTERSVVDVASADGRLVAVGSTNGRAAVWTSSDGTSWKRAAVPSVAASNQRQRLLKVAHGSRGWLAIGTDGRRPLLATSADGTSWQWQDPSAFAPHGGRSVTLAGVAAGPKGYLIVGRDALGDRESSAVAWFSADLRSWQPARQDGLAAEHGTSREMTAVAATPTGFAAVGASSTKGVPATHPARPAIWVSNDGLAWTEKEAVGPTGVQNIRLTHIVAAGRVFVAGGEGQAPGDRAVAVASSDAGNTWRGGTLPTPTGNAASFLGAAAARNGTITLVGMFGSWHDGDTIRWTSQDGQAWQPTVPQGPGLSGEGRQQIGALTASGGGLLGVGISTGGDGDQLTLWRFDES
ncbi:hypothetical protein [Actinomadura rayongensis]|uniref:Exo-alpha-sialidase n=1 Tax=Actinomadura rayongensis TaxID=1429076 RepID=A0A6I4W676_9ACTN|nr:hypothetical protein [Actinomadura rayongensis]MXQ64773.1 hypothetical protein [Actinomadura rayongensis]